MPSHNSSTAGLRSGKQVARPWFIPAAIGGGCLILTLLIWQLTLLQSQPADQIRFERLADRVQQSIMACLSRHEQCLSGLKGLFAASKSVERGEFRDYVKSLNLTAYPGIIGFGFAHYVARADLDRFLTRTRADEAPDFKVNTNGNQSDLFVIEYIEPFLANQAAQGFDIGSEARRREAATQAVDQNQIVLTRAVTVHQEQKQLPGFLLLSPIFANGAPTATAAERWHSLNGWVYSAIKIEGLMSQISAEIDDQLDFEIFEVDDLGHTVLLFDANDRHGAVTALPLLGQTFQDGKFHRVSRLTFGGRTWQLQIGTLPKFSGAVEHRFSWLVLAGGLLCSALLTYAADSSQRVRRKAATLAEKMTAELRGEISMREKLHHTLSELSSFQDAILRSAAHAIISTTPDGVIQIFNPAAQRLLGYTADEMIGRQTPVIFHDPAEVAARAKEFSAELGVTVEPGFGVFVIKSCKGMPNEHEWTYVCKDGSRVPVMLSVTAVRDDQGGFSGYIGIAVDMTERKRAWAELLQSRHTSDEARHELELQRDALDQHAIVSITDLKGIIRHANDRFCTISGYSRKELIGQSHRIVNSGHHPATFWTDFWQTINAGEIWRGEICNRAKNGQLYWVDATVVPFHDANGEIGRFVAIRTDITARKLAKVELLEARKTAEAASRSKSEFLAEMSHEIRTPMNAVLGFTDLLAMTPLNEKQRGFVDTIKLSGQNLLTLINDILDYSKIEAGKLEVERLDFDAVDSAETVIKTLSLQANNKSLALTLRNPPGTPRLVNADPIRVRQVLINLVGNALKFTKSGGVTISTELVPADGKSKLRINVTDTGIGLSPEQQARLFTRFTQAKTSTTREFGGTGLGLAICKRLVELMDGEIGVISAEGQGATFWFTLPLSAHGKPAEAAIEQGTTHRIEPIQLRPPTPSPTPTVTRAYAWQVLVVDDNQINQQLACAFLNKLNCQSSLANDGAEAAKMVQQKAFDLVLMDYQMPVMDGMQATTAIRHWEAAQSGRKRLPIIALTANLSPEISSNFIACGMDACLAKPLMFSELKAIIAQLGPVSAPARPDTPPPPAMAPAGQPTAMDRQRSLQLTDNNPALLGMLAQAFLLQCDGMMENIRQALQSRDETALKSHAHKLKGSISVFAADSAQAVVLALNKFPSPPDWAELDQIGRKLETEIARLRPELVALTSPTASPS